ncbi:hypothetical protein BH20CHL7_BH20CHL7_10010 [soil metagenome]
MHYYTYLALDLANERTREAELYRRRRMLTDLPARPSVVRRVLADLLAAVKAIVAGIRRPSGDRAEDLGEPLAAR